MNSLAGLLIQPYVLLYSRVPVREYRSIWMELAMQNIFFYDQNNNPVYDYRQLLIYDGEEVSDEIMYLFIQDIKNTGEWG